MGVVRRLRTEELSAQEVAALRDLFRAAWSDDPEAFTEEDWEHATGGIHLIVEDEGEIVAHAAVVERDLETNGHRLRTGYVEAVATDPARQRRGHGTAVMQEAGWYIDAAFQLGALDTGLPGFYQRLDWVVWEGPTLVRTSSGPVRTPDDDGAVMVKLTPSTPQLDVTEPISCEWRSGDVW